MTGAFPMRTLILAATVAAAFATQAFAAAPNMSDAEARRGIEGNWNTMKASLLLGDRAVDKDAAAGSCATEMVDLDQYKFLLGAEKSGYVNISYPDDVKAFARDKTLSVQDMLRLASTGTVKKFNVKATPLAMQFKTDYSSDCLSFKVGDFQVDKVVRNQPFQQAGRDLREIDILYRVTYQQIMSDIRDAADMKATQNRKAHLVLQYLSGKASWMIMAYDAANVDADYTTKNFDNYLAKLK
jgi:hypothetical protein